MQIVLTGLWKEALEVFPQLERELPAAMDKALYAEAQDLRKVMVRQFAAQKPATGPGWAPLSDFTLDARKAQGFSGSKILIRNADLRNSVAVTRVSRGEIFVGVNRTAGNVKGGSFALVNLGVVHELGATIKITVTRKMQRFFFGVIMKHRRKRIKAGRDSGGRFLPKGQRAPSFTSKGTFRVGAQITIRIPARPFIGPAIAYKSQQEYEASIAERLATLIRGKLGKP